MLGSSKRRSRIAQETFAVWLPASCQLLFVGHTERTKYTGSKEKCNEGKDHLVTKVLAKEEHAQHDPDGYDAQDRHHPLDQLQDLAEFVDVAGKLVHEVAREAIRPKGILAFAESDL